MDRPGGAHACLNAHAQGVTLAVKVSPNAGRTAAKGLWNQRLRVRVQAPPVAGKANHALLKWVAQSFGLRDSQVSLLAGRSGAEKLLLLEGLRLEEAQAALDRLLPDNGQGS
jgi:hypothetical protein